MAFWSRKRTRPYIGNPTRVRASSNALTAAGARVHHRDAQVMRRLIQPWQTRALSYYDMLGEVKYAANYVGHAMSLLSLFPAQIQDDGEVTPTDDPIAEAALARIQDPGGGTGARSGLQEQYGKLMFLTGEAYLLVSSDPFTGLEQWEVLSTDELRVMDGIIMRYRAPSLMIQDYHEVKDDEFFPIDDKDAVAYRLWKRSPRWSALADSSMAGVLMLCEELLLLTAVVRARARSRQAGNGILFLDEAFSQTPLEPLGDEDPQNDIFMTDLTESMTASIENEGSASAVVPLIVRVPVPDGKKVSDMVYHLQLVDPTQLYPETGLRRECIERIAIGLDLPSSILTGIEEANHWCVDEETEILVRGRGWVTEDDLEVGDTVLTLNHETGFSEWKPVEHIYRASVRDEPMREFDSRTHSSLTTAAHRWPVLRQRWKNGKQYQEREWVTTEEFSDAHSIVIGAPCGDQPNEAVYSNELVELAAWFWTEGSASGTPCIAQSHSRNPERVERIRGVLSRLGEEVETLRGTTAPAWRSRVQDSDSSYGGPVTVFYLNRYLAEPLSEIAPKKRVSQEFISLLTDKQLELFIDVSCQADGQHYREGRFDIWQRDPDALDAFELAVILSGRASSRLASHEGGTRIDALRTKSVRPAKAAQEAERIGCDEGATDRMVLYTGVVWCPTTENGTWLARRKGKTFYTGNSAWAVDEQTWKAHLQPMAQQLCSDLTQAYFRPYLRDQGVDDWQSYVIDYDASLIINHPDRGSAADAAYDRGTLSDDSYRKAKGFDDSDAPSQPEKNTWLGVKMRDPGLAVFGTPSLRQNSELETAPGVLEIPPVGAPGSPGAESRFPAPGPGGSSAETTKDKPPQPVSGTVVGSGEVQMAGELAVFRARELAGSRLRSYAKRDPEAHAMLDGVRNIEVAAKLGPDRVKALARQSETQLVSGATDLIEEALRLYGVTDEAMLKLFVTNVEKHAAKTLFDARPAPLPSSLINRLVAAKP